MAPASASASYSSSSAPAPAAASPCTCFKVRSLSRRLTQLYDETIAPSGLRSTQFSLLANARRPRGGVPPSVTELADAMSMDRTTLTRNLRPLVAAGLVALESGSDARSKAVVVTAAGERAFLEARELWKLAQKRVRKVGGLENVERLEALTGGLMASFDEHDGSPA